MVLKIASKLVKVMLMVLLMHPIPSSSTTSSSDMLFIRHGRSRVRHSNEKDYLRWGLKALDNLTLDYDMPEGYDNDTLILIGNDIWSMDNTTYFNQTTNYTNTSSSRNYDEKLSIHNTTPIPTVLSPSSSSSSPPPPTRKKLAKKKIMENIRKNVDKGLEYLKMHKHLGISVTSQEFGYQNDAGTSKGTSDEGNILQSRSEIRDAPTESSSSTTIPPPPPPQPHQYSEESHINKNLPHSVPARLSVPYKQQLAAREGESNNLENNDKNVSTINLNIDNQDDDTSSISNGLYLDGGPYQSPSTSGFTNGASEDSSDDIVAGLSPEDDDDDDNESTDDDALANVYGASDQDLSELDEISRNNRLNLMKGRDVVTKFLQIVETQHLLGANCTAGTALNLGEGVVDQYA